MIRSGSTPANRKYGATTTRPGAQPSQPFQHSGHGRLGQRDEPRLDARVPTALPQQPGHLGDLGVRVRIGGASPDQRDIRARPLRAPRPWPPVRDLRLLATPGHVPSSERGVDPLLQQGLQHRVRAKRAAVQRSAVPGGAPSPGPGRPGCRPCRAPRRSAPAGRRPGRGRPHPRCPVTGTRTVVTGTDVAVTGSRIVVTGDRIVVTGDRIVVDRQPDSWITGSHQRRDGVGQGGGRAR